MPCRASNLYRCCNSNSRPSRVVRTSHASSFRRSHTSSSTSIKHARLLESPARYEGNLQTSGLIRSLRRSKSATFVHVSDGTTIEPVQAVLDPELADGLSNGSYVELTGKWTPSLGKGQSHELRVVTIDTHGQGQVEDSPIQKKSLTADHLRNFPHLRLRTPLHLLINQARSELISYAHRFYSKTTEDAAMFVQPPLITSSDCEGAGEVFTITPRSGVVQTPSVSSQISAKADSAVSDSTASDLNVEERGKHYFGSPKYLTVSSQLHLEAYSAAFGDVWTLSPTFRAELSDTPRHLSEFYMLEAEFRSVAAVAQLTEKVHRLIQTLGRDFAAGRTAKQLLAYVNDKKFDHEVSSEELEARWAALDAEWMTISYDNAMATLQEASGLNGHLFKHKPLWENGLQLEHERWLVGNVSNNRPLFVTDYPRQIKPFYMLANETSSKDRPTVACFDLLLPYGTCELVGGSIREHRLGPLIANMREKGLIKPGSEQQTATAAYPGLRENETLGTMQWYADLRRFGSSPHGGFGMGFDRLLMYLTGTSNVRDAVAFPRTWGRAEC